jgi:TP901 family phage tail tape measure protein
MAINLPIVSKFDPKGIKAAESALGKFGKLAAATAAAATAAIAGVATASIKAFANFDSKLNESIAIMGDVSDVLRDDMAAAAREVAKQTTFSADQAAESYFFLASAGLDAAASIEAMPQVAKFAQAGMFDMALATDLLTDAQSALGLTIRDDAVANMENMVRVSDTLVRANTLANASVEQFSTALTTKAGAALRSIGKDVEEGVAVLAAFADQGIKGELAGTQLAIVLRDLSTKAIKNKEDFAELGIEVFDANGEMRNLGDIIANLENVLAGMSDETQKATLLQAGFSDKSLASITALLGTSDAIKTYEKELRSAAGFTDQVSNKQLDTMSAQFELVKSRIADVGIEIGGNLAPMFLKLIDEMEPVIKQAGPALVEFFKAIGPVIAGVVQSLPTIFSALTAAINVVTIAVRDYLYPAFVQAFGWIKDNIPTVATFVGVLGSLVAVFQVVTNATKIYATAQAALAVVMAVNPFYLIAVAIAAVAAGIVYLATQTTFFQDTWAAVTKFFTDAYNNYVKPVIDAFMKGINDLYNKVIKPVFEAAMLILGLWAGTWVLIYESIIKPVIDLLVGALKHLFDFASLIFGNIANEFKKLGAFFTDVFNAVFTPVAEGIETGFNHLGRFIEDVNNNVIIPVFEAFGTAFKWVYENMIRPVSEFIEDTITNVGNAFRDVFQGVKDFMETIFNALVGVVKTPLNAIIDYVNGVIKALNTIQVTIPDWVPVWGGRNFGINIPKVPKLADGGVVMPRPGGVLANIAEGGQPEAVIPLNKFDKLGSQNNFNITVNAGMGADGSDIGRKIVDEIIRYERASGRVFARA